MPPLYTLTLTPIMNFYLQMQAKGNAGDRILRLSYHYFLYIFLLDLRNLNVQNAKKTSENFGTAATIE